jgi:glycerol-3-phosphate acyltransferase PlsY
MDLSGLAWSAIGFLVGSIPFSVLVGRLVAGVDVRGVADGNPGATNAFRAAGRSAGVAALVLDISKGAATVSLAVWAGDVSGPWLVPVLIAPVAGHCWSPWLRFRGGKGLATAYGVLIPVTLPLGPVVMPALLVVAYLVVAPDGWAAALASLGTLAGLVLAGASAEVLVGAALVLGLVASRYRADLVTVPHRRRRPPRA